MLPLFANNPQGFDKDCVSIDTSSSIYGVNDCLLYGLYNQYVFSTLMTTPLVKCLLFTNK